MGERKVVNKYIPADFDPTLIPRGKKLSSKDGTVPVRMMLPFSIQCSTCNTFLYRGRKFNSKKEPMSTGPDGYYLGIERFRFYFKCGTCSRPITFLTDPKNADYEMESGGTRNYDVNKDKKSTEEAQSNEQKISEQLDPMKALENRVVQSQLEMIEIDQLEEIRALNSKHTKLNINQLIESKKLQQLRYEQEEINKETLLSVDDEKLIKSIKFGQQQSQQSQQQSLDINIEVSDDDDYDDEIDDNDNKEKEELVVQSSLSSKKRRTVNNTNSSNNFIRRLNENDEIEHERKRQKDAEVFYQKQKQQQQQQKQQQQQQQQHSVLPTMNIKMKKKIIHPTVTTVALSSSTTTKPVLQNTPTKKIIASMVTTTDNNINKTNENGNGLSSLIGDYGSSSSSSSSSSNDEK